MSPVAAIDCGTNSTRLLILDDNGTELARELRLTRLGEGVHERRELLPAAIARTSDAVSEFKELLDVHNVSRLRIGATSAARDALNANLLFDRLEHITGVKPELISGDEEARLTYAGASLGLGGRPCLVIDIGGGSTELIVGHDDSVVYARSLDVGCVRLTERFLHSDPYKRAELDKAFAAVDDLLVPVSKDIESAVGGSAQLSEYELIGAAGTATTLASVQLGLTTYDPTRTHHQVISRDDVEGLFVRLAEMTQRDRLASPLMPPGRADVIVAGAVILLATMRLFAFANYRVSETDILDGIAIRLLSN